MSYEPDPLLISQAISKQRETEAVDFEPGIELIERARQILIAVARNGQRITYSQFASQLAEPSVNGMSCDPLLIRVAEFEAEAGRPLLGVIVVNSHNRRPSKAFCELAREIRQWECDDEETYLKELTLVNEYWRPV